MKLYNNRPSPYGRKVLIAAHEKSLMERITLLQIDPWSDPSALLAGHAHRQSAGARHRRRRGDHGQHDHQRIF